MKRRSVLREPSIGFIIDLYSPYQKNQNVAEVFKIHGIPYCIREIEKFEWGQPQFPEKNIEDEFNYYHVYATKDEALKYIHELKRIEGSRF